MKGKKELLGMWIAPNEGVKFWLGIMTELKNRGMKDLFMASVNGLKGLPEAIETTFPEVKVPLCTVHMVRNSIKYLIWQDRKEVWKDLKVVYAASADKKLKSHPEAFGHKVRSRLPDWALSIYTKICTTSRSRSFITGSGSRKELVICLLLHLKENIIRSIILISQ